MVGATHLTQGPSLALTGLARAGHAAHGQGNGFLVEAAVP